MNIELIVVGKTDMKEVAALVDMYTKRINFYNKFNITYLPDIRNSKNLSEAQQKTAEGDAILRLIDDSDRRKGRRVPLRRVCRVAPKAYE